MFRAFISMVVFYAVLVPMTAFAGSLDSPGAPSAGSGMPTLQGICTQLDTGVPAPLLSGPFAEPSAGPGSTMCTLTQISAKAPVTDVAGAGPGDVLSGKKYWGLLSGNWGRQTGTLPSGSNVTGGNGLLNFAIPDGYYSGKTATAVDANLSSANIKAGVTVFGETGTYPTSDECCYYYKGCNSMCTEKRRVGIYLNDAQKTACGDGCAIALWPCPGLSFLSCL